MSSSTIGLDPTRVTSSPEFGLGSFGHRDDAEYVYVKASGAISAAGEVLAIDGLNQAAPLTTSNDAVGRRVGVAPGVVTSGSYFWALLRGETLFLVAGNCSANSALRATSTSGVVDDSGSGPVLDGMVATEDAGAMQELVSGRLVYPTLQEAGGGGSGVSDFISLDDTPAAFGTVGQAAVVNAARDALVFADAGGSFDLHDDITTEVTAIAGSDRFVISDESGTGDPNRYVEHRDLLNSIRDVLNVNNSTPDTTDRFYCSDESGTGDPMEYITLAQLSAAIQDGTVDTVTMAVVGQILTLTIGRTVGLDIVATATLPAGGGGGGGGGGLLTTTVTPGTPNSFAAPLEELTSFNPAATAVNVVILTAANFHTNRGGFTREDGSSSRAAVGIPSDGTYNIDVDLYFISTTAATRISLYVDLVVVRESVVVADLTSTGSEYYRGSTGTNQGYLNISATTDLLAGDEIELRMREASTTGAVFTVGGLNSRIDITQIVGTPVVSVTGFPIPGLIGSAFSGILAINTFADSGVALPTSGWIRLVGTVAAGSGFSISIPVSLINGLVEEVAGQLAAVATGVKFPAAAGLASVTVLFGHDSSGNILIASNTAEAATLSVYEE